MSQLTECTHNGGSGNQRHLNDQHVFEAVPLPNHVLILVGHDMSPISMDTFSFHLHGFASCQKAFIVYKVAK